MKHNIPALLSRFTDGHLYRQATMEDIVPGAELVMCPIPGHLRITDSSLALGELPHGEKRSIRIDDVPYDPGKTTIYYHCIISGRALHQQQCFVQTDYMVGTEQESRPGPDWFTIYLVPINQHAATSTA